MHIVVPFALALRNACNHWQRRPRQRRRRPPPTKKKMHNFYKRHSRLPNCHRIEYKDASIMSYKWWRFSIGHSLNWFLLCYASILCYRNTWCAHCSKKKTLDVYASEYQTSHSDETFIYFHSVCGYCAVVHTIEIKNIDKKSVSERRSAHKVLFVIFLHRRRRTIRGIFLHLAIP